MGSMDSRRQRTRDSSPTVVVVRGKRRRKMLTPCKLESSKEEDVLTSVLRRQRRCLYTNIAIVKKIRQPEKDCFEKHKVIGHF